MEGCVRECAMCIDVADGSVRDYSGRQEEIDKAGQGRAKHERGARLIDPEKRKRKEKEREFVCKHMRFGNEEA